MTPSPSSICILTRTLEHPNHTLHPALTDAIFKANVLKHKTYYETLRSQLGLVDFNPLTVDWTTPVPWGNDPDHCNMDDDSGAPA